MEPKTVNYFISTELMKKNLNSKDLDEVQMPKRIDRIIGQRQTNNIDLDSGDVILSYLEEDPRVEEVSNRAILFDFFNPDQELEDAAKDYVEYVAENEEKINPGLDGLRLFSSSMEAIEEFKQEEMREENTHFTFPNTIIALPYEVREDINLAQQIGPYGVDELVSKPEELQNDDNYVDSGNDKVGLPTDDLTMFAVNMKCLIQDKDRKNSIVPHEFYNAIEEYRETYTGL